MQQMLDPGSNTIKQVAAPAMRIRGKPGRSWTIEEARRRYQKPEASRLLENKFGMRRWRSSHRAAKYCEELRGDRVAGFSAIPAMSMLSYAAGSRFVRLFGSLVLSFYDFYVDFPPASSETWGEKADVADSRNSKYIVPQVVVCWPS